MLMPSCLKTLEQLQCLQKIKRTATLSGQFRTATVSKIQNSDSVWKIWNRRKDVQCLENVENMEMRTATSTVSDKFWTIMKNRMNSSFSF